MTSSIPAPAERFMHQLPERLTAFVADLRRQGFDVDRAGNEVTIKIGRHGRLAVQHELMTPGELARFLRVDPRTVARWNNDGKLNAIWTPGGSRRYRTADVLTFLIGSQS